MSKETLAHAQRLCAQNIEFELKVAISKIKLASTIDGTNDEGREILADELIVIQELLWTAERNIDKIRNLYRNR